MIHDLLKFIEQSPVSFFAIDNLKRILQEAGFSPVSLMDAELSPGGRYYMTRNDSSLIAFRIPRERAKGFVISASHSDSPCLRIRDNAELKGPAIRLETERYGGLINPSWVDRPLSVAGRVMVREEAGVASRLVNLKRDCALIPNVAIHMQKGINESAKYNPATDLLAMFCEKGREGSFREVIAQEIDVDPEEILSWDLYLYNNQPGTVWGPAGEFASSPRLDDLACVYTCTEAFLDAEETDRVPVLCVFDNEEIGSGTKQGAASDFLPRVLKMISESLYLSPAQHLALLDNSFMLSCDNGHAKHPNHPEIADPNEAPEMNGGVVIKHSPRYATDAVSSALFSEICRRAHVPVQHYSNRPDMPGGGTLGLIANLDTPVYTVDIGLAQLAMHSSFETMGSRDARLFYEALKASYESRIDFRDSEIHIC
ncbi:MAG: M18 family aminopeptidase [Lachnospiraceae bacterium]|nr:M18 family aminopeptidase [Lachnospiraceae bacterium]